MRDRSASSTRSAAFFIAALATISALILAFVALLASQSLAAPAALPWLLALGMGFTAAGIGSALWRQRELESALREARLQAHGLADLIDAWHWRSDNAHRLTLLRAPASEPDAQWSAADVRGQPAWEQFGTDGASVATLRARMEAGSRLDGLRVWRQAKDGERQQVELRGAALTDALGRFAGYLGSARVVADDAPLRGDQQLLRALLQNLQAPVLVLEGADHAQASVERANGAAAQWLGIKPAQLEGMACADLLTRMPADLRSAVQHALSDAGEGAQPPVAGWDLRLQRIDVDRDPRAAAQGEPHRWILTLVPKATASAAPDTAASDSESFSYTVSHDLRAPIRVVEGFTRILKEDYGRQLDRIGNDHLERVLGAAARMNSMIDALLALSQLSSRPLSRQPVNLSQLASYVVDDLRRQSPERRVSVQIESGLQAQGDPTLLRMALENLLGNAWKYTAKKRDAQIWFERGVHEGQPVFTVRDNGAGFDMRFADRLFGVFQRLHSASDFPGTGVGLASVRRIVNRHGGEIWAESAVDQGSSFHFTLPAAAGA